MKDVNTVLDEIGLGNYHYVQLLIIGGISIADGAEILVSSSVIGALSNIWGLSNIARGFMMSAIFIGVLVGGLIGGNLGDILGRRPLILFSYLGIIVFGVATATANGPWSMLALRFLFGASFGAGIGPAMVIMVESAPSKSRGHLINFGGIFFAIGEIYTSLLLMVFMPSLTDTVETQAWRRVTVLSVVPGAMLFPLAYFLLKESPHYLLSQGRDEEALETVKYIAHMNGREEAVRGLEQEQGADPEAASSGLNRGGAGERTALLVDQQVPEDDVLSGSDQAVSETSAAAESRAMGNTLPSSNKITEKERGEILFAPGLRNIVFGGAYLCFISNFLFYGMTYSMPQILRQLGANINPAQEVLTISLCDLPGVVLGWWLINSKTIGHRDGLCLMAVVIAFLQFAMISIDHGSGWLLVGMVAAPLAKFVACAFFTLTYVYLGEVFPAAVRCTGLSLCIAAGRLGSILAPLCFEALSQNSLATGRHSPYMMLNVALCGFAVAMIRSLLTFELKNAPLEDVPSKHPQNMSRRPSLTVPPSGRTGRSIRGSQCSSESGSEKPGYTGMASSNEVLSAALQRLSMRSESASSSSAPAAKALGRHID